MCSSESVLVTIYPEPQPPHYAEVGVFIAKKIYRIILMSVVEIPVLFGLSRVDLLRKGGGPAARCTAKGPSRDD